MDRRKRFLVLLLILAIGLPPTPIGGAGGADESSEATSRSGGLQLLAELESELRIPPGSHYAASYDPASGSFTELTPSPPLTDKALRALALAPDWLRSPLERQFRELGSSMDSYADVILGLQDLRLLDEVAFSIAFTSPEILKHPQFNPALLVENAASVYAADPVLPYVELTEKGGRTTVTYVNATGSPVELPDELYYWYIVHPRLSDEMPAYISPSSGQFAPPPTGRFWRDYLLNHADPGYPLLRDALSCCTRLWGGLKNTIEGNGAVGAITKWVQDVMDFGSDSERPIQPVRIYAKHLGRCGEHEDLTAAAARAALVPCIGAEDLAEDHVWNEFWDGRWVQWEPVNTYIDFPESYAGWGKRFPSVNAPRGDAFVWPLTAHYTSVCRLTVQVRDARGRPVDGATVWLGCEVQGNPSYRFVATWNSTDSLGRAGFEVGKNLTLYARVDSEGLRGYPTAQAGSTGMNPYVLFASDVVMVGAAPLPECLVFNISLGASAPDPREGVRETAPPGGNYRLELRLEALESDVRGRSAFGQHYYLTGEPMPLLAFITDEYDGFNRSLSCGACCVLEGTELCASAELPSPNWTLVVVNGALSTYTKVRIATKLMVRPYITILSPREGSLVSGGSTVRVEGEADAASIASVELSVDGGESWLPASRSGVMWWLDWNTSGLPSCERKILARLRHGGGELVSEALSVRIDADDPEVTIECAPVLRGGESHTIQGDYSDNTGVRELWMRIEGPGLAGGWVKLDIAGPSGSWRVSLETAAMCPGTFRASVRAVDLAGREGVASKLFTLDFEPPVVFIETSGTFPDGAEVLLTGEAMDEVLLRCVVVVAGGTDLEADIEGQRWSALWNTSGLSSGVYTITATAEDAAGWSSSASGSIKIDADPPEIRIELPQQAEAGSQVLIRGTIRDSSGIRLAELSTDGVNWSELEPDGGEWEYLWDTSGLAPGRWEVVVRGWDDVNKSAESRAWIELVDTTPPVVRVSAPTNIEAGTVFLVRAVVEERHGLAKVELSAAGLGPWPMELKGDRYCVELNSSVLPLGRVVLKVRAVDLAGNEALETGTVAVLDTTPPEIQIIEFWVEKGRLVASGLARDNHRIRSVEHRLDGGPWGPAALENGTWSLTIAAPGPGPHRIELRARDEAGREAITFRDFTIEHPREEVPGVGPWPLAASAGLLVALIGAGFVLLRRRNGGGVGAGGEGEGGNGGGAGAVINKR
ncbi:MAG: Ig-like domain-containing protein [Thermoplasmata archaeon]